MNAGPSFRTVNKIINFQWRILTLTADVFQCDTPSAGIISLFPRAGLKNKILI